MKPVHFTNLARADLIDNWVRIALHDEATANRVFQSLTEACLGLGDFPELGKARPEIASDVRALVSERWLLLYRNEPDRVLVVRIVDGARDLAEVEVP